MVRLAAKETLGIEPRAALSADLPLGGVAGQRRIERLAGFFAEYAEMLRLSSVIALSGSRTQRSPAVPVGTWRQLAG